MWLSEAVLQTTLAEQAAGLGAWTVKSGDITANAGPSTGSAETVALSS